MSKINSETSFLYQLFKDNLNFIVLKPCKVICFSIFIIFIIIYIYSYVYLCIYTPSYQHFKAFPVSKINSETSFLCQLFKDNLNFIVLKPCKVIFFSIFIIFIIIYIYSYVYLCIYTPSYQHFKLKPSRCLISIPRQVY